MKKCLYFSAVFVSMLWLLAAVSCKTEGSPQEILVGNMDIEGEYYFGGTAEATFSSEAILVGEKTDSRENESINYVGDRITDKITTNEQIKITNIEIVNASPAFLTYQYVSTKRTNINSYKVEIPVRVRIKRTVTENTVRVTETVSYIKDEFGNSTQQTSYSTQYLPAQTSETENVFESTYTVNFMKIGKNYYCNDSQIYEVDGNPADGSFKLGACSGKINTSASSVEIGESSSDFNISVTSLIGCQNLNFSAL